MPYTGLPHLAGSAAYYRTLCQDYAYFKYTKDTSKSYSSLNLPQVACEVSVNQNYPVKIKLLITWET